MLRRDFSKGLARIRGRLQETRFDGDFLSWDTEYPAGCPPHAAAPFAFKPHCFAHARALGYEQVLWVDAAARIKRPLDAVFEIIERTGYLIVDGINPLGRYCRDAALAPLGLSREESFTLKSCWAAIIGLNFKDPRCREFLSLWLQAAGDGITFVGPKWSGVKGGDTMTTMFRMAIAAFRNGICKLGPQPAVEPVNCGAGSPSAFASA